MKHKILYALLPCIVFYFTSLIIGTVAWYTTFKEQDIEWDLIYTAPLITGVVFMFNPIAWVVLIYAILFIFIFRKWEIHKRYYNWLLIGIIIATVSSYPLFREALIF